MPYINVPINPITQITKGFGLGPEFGAIGGFVGDWAKGIYGTAAAKKIVTSPKVISSGIGYGRAALIGAGTGAVGFIGGSLLSKKEQQQQAAPQEQELYQAPSFNVTSNQYTYSPQSTYNTQSTYAPSWALIENSAGATITKKDIATGTLASNPSQAVSPFQQTNPIQDTSATQAQEQQQKQDLGTDWTTLALIAGVALVGYGYVTKKK